MNIGEVAHARQNENKFSFVLACSQHCQTFFETAVSWHPIKIGCYLLTEMNIGEVAHAQQSESTLSLPSLTRNIAIEIENSLFLRGWHNKKIVLGGAVPPSVKMVPFEFRS